MNQFSTKILNAKKKQQSFFFKVITVIFFISLISLLCFFFILSKKIVINPNINNYNIEVSGGKGFILFKRVLFVESSLKIKVVAEGYETYENKFIKQEIENIYIKLIKKDTNLVFKANTSIGQNNWFLDNKLISNEKELILKIKPGVYNLRIENKFYKSKSIELNLSDKTNKKNYELKLDRLKGRIDIITEPKDALLFIDGKEFGKSNNTYELESGNYEIKLIKEGYQAISQNIEINKNNLIINNKYTMSPNKVKVNLNLEPDNGKLQINGAMYETDKSLNLYTKKKYSFIYNKEGYREKEKDYIFYENKNNEVEFLLEKEFGEISIISNPLGNIKINGKDYGSTPKKLKLQTTNQKLEITKDGFVPYVTDIKTKPNLLSKVEIKLEKKLDNIKRLSKEKYLNTIGIQLKLFAPGSYTMGAPRHEKGQRANEFLKDVILRKKFYVSLTEVTIEQFMKSRNISYKKEDKNFPISNISWLEATSFCNWLSEKEGLESVYIFDKKKYIRANLQNNGYRLPTEAEWEWLARKAGKNKLTKFSWGKNLPIPKMVGNLADESVKGFKELYIPNYNDKYKLLAPVGSFKKDLSGLYDVTGNVKEWVHDYYLVSVPKSNMIYYDPSGPKKGVGHVIKGSSYLSATLHEVRASYRDSEVNKKDDIGFRIARYLFGKEFKNDAK
ncbi:MAG: SUMF1/EgtB/PvdO family nonheme iron enzyme [Pseudomonadota bacterium]|nr:SUMF1/EgtB/PvdO family nonheme iron enzyme [Pseudomonadota bacterium]